MDGVTKLVRCVVDEVGGVGEFGLDGGFVEVGQVG